MVLFGGKLFFLFAKRTATDVKGEIRERGREEVPTPVCVTPPPLCILGQTSLLHPHLNMKTPCLHKGGGGGGGYATRGREGAWELETGHAWTRCVGLSWYFKCLVLRRGNVPREESRSEGLERERTASRMYANL